MNILTSRLSLLYTSLLLMVLVGAGHIHSHICLDGQELAALVHFENLGDHPVHDASEIHTDIEQELNPELVAGKLLGHDVMLFLAASLIQDQAESTLAGQIYTEDKDRYFSSQTSLLPPPRAPPAYSS